MRKKKRFYINRAFGCDCHYCSVNGDINAGPAEGKKTGKGSGLSV